MSVSTQWTVDRFLKKLSSGEPAPGGGSAAALAGALGCGLGRMVATILLSRKKIRPPEKRALKKEIQALTRVGKKLEDLIEEDARAYLILVQAQQGKKVSRSKMKELRRKAAQCPLDICVESVKGIQLLSVLLKCTGPYLGSDVRAGQQLLRGAFGAARAMVEVNLLGAEKTAEAKAVRARLNQTQRIMERFNGNS